MTLRLLIMWCCMMFKMLNIPEKYKVDLDISVEDIIKNTSHMKVNTFLMKMYLDILKVQYSIKSHGEKNTNGAIDKSEILFIKIKLKDAYNSIVIVNHIFKMFPYLTVICLELGEYCSFAVSEIRKNKRDSTLNIVSSMSFGEWINKEDVGKHLFDINYSLDTKDIYIEIEKKVCNKYKYNRVKEFFDDEKFLNEKIINSIYYENINYSVEEDLVERNQLYKIVILGMKSVFGLSKNYIQLIKELDREPPISYKSYKDVNSTYDEWLDSNYLFRGDIELEIDKFTNFNKSDELNNDCSSYIDYRETLFNRIRRDLKDLRIESLTSINHGYVELFNINDVEELLAQYISEDMLVCIMDEVYSHRFEIHDKEPFGFSYASEYW